MRDGPGEEKRAVEERANLLHEREWGEHTAVASGSRADCNESVGTFLEGLACVSDVYDVVEDDAAIRVNRGVQVFARTERRDDDGNFVANARLDVVIEAVIDL